MNLVGRTLLPSVRIGRGPVALKSLRKKRKLDEQIARAVDLYITGLSSMVIGNRLGFDNHTIIKTLREQDVPIQTQLGR